MNLERNSKLGYNLCVCAIHQLRIASLFEHSSMWLPNRQLPILLLEMKFQILFIIFASNESLDLMNHFSNAGLETVVHLFEKDNCQNLGKFFENKKTFLELLNFKNSNFSIFLIYTLWSTEIASWIFFWTLHFTLKSFFFKNAISSIFSI